MCPSEHDEMCPSEHDEMCPSEHNWIKNIKLAPKASHTQRVRKMATINIKILTRSLNRQHIDVP